MHKPSSIEEECQFIWYLEEKYNLLDFEISGVKVWQYARVEIDYIITERMGLFQKAHTGLSKAEKLKHILHYIKNSITDNYFTLKKSNVVVLADSRVVNVDGEYIDIYTKYIIDELKKNVSVTEIEKAYAGVHKKQKHTYTHYNDWIKLMQTLFQPFVSIKLSKNELELLKKVESEINNTCEISFDLMSFVKNKLKVFRIQNYIYKKVFKKLGAKTLYMTNSYGQAPLIQAAKDNGLEVVELQHGTFSHYHLGYSFPGREVPLDYFPDKFYVWNEFWKNLIRFPLTDGNIVIDKFRYLEVQKLKYIHLQKIKKRVIILSQGALGEMIAKIILNHYDKFKDNEIFYKLHPEDYARWKSYPSLVTLSKNINVNIIRDEVPLYELFATSNFQVGVFSTALYEGIEFGCKTILLNLPGIEYMYKLLEVRNDIEILK